MRIPLTEIWNFIDLIDRQEKGWTYALHAAKYVIEDIRQEVLTELRQDPEYDTELLPSLFTFRELLWQPDVFTEASQSLPGIRILKSFCEETIQQLETSERAVDAIYRGLIQGVAEHCAKAESRLEGKPKTLTVTRVLGELRRDCFPIIKFFIYHPQNRVDYYRDAINRLNYAVKIMLTEFNGRYTDLSDPFWIVSYRKAVSKTEKAADLKNNSTETI